jgi:hypothetical protein
MHTLIRHDIFLKKRHRLGPIRELGCRATAGVHIRRPIQRAVDSLKQARAERCSAAPVVGFESVGAQDDGCAQEFCGNGLEVRRDVCGVLAGCAVEGNVASARVAPE